jgi:cytidine deaminase
MTEKLPDNVLEELVDRAREASAHAYSPYSSARVGAAVLCADGRIFVGCNVENASYGLTQCAERNALNSAIAAGAEPRSMRSLVIYASGFQTLTPCGACRQVMSELLAEDAVVLCRNASGETESWRLRDLFPHPFLLE